MRTLVSLSLAARVAPARAGDAYLNFFTADGEA